VRARSWLCIAVAAAALPAGGAAARPSPPLSPIVEPNQGYAPVYSLLASPKHTLDLTMYELDDAKVERILTADARRGVVVRVLLDRDYIGTYNQAAFTYLQQHRVRVRWGSTKVGITHEKSFVVDGSTAVITTGNFTSEYYSTTRDFAIVDRDRKDVAAIERTFGLDWANESGAISNGADLVWSPGSQSALVSLIDSARRSLLVETEEMSASSIVAALEAAARRGVDVDVTMTRAHAWIDAFDALVEAGVHVRTYSPSASLYIHAKAIDVDNKRIFVGSENFSVASMVYNRELGLVTEAPAVEHEIRATLSSDFDHGQPWYP
jgi:phosphatidylserine/phosphatidylglycerophosphate/cardiolipin synthase-like enzyme